MPSPIVPLTTPSLPAPNVIQELLEELHRKYTALNEGSVASYIPELAKACPQDFGIAIATADGRLYEVGDTRASFTIQSISKPFVFGLGMKLLSPEFLSRKVDVEPSGEAFNAISLDPLTGKPRNPMINAGAIAISAQISSHTPDAAMDLLLEHFAELAGRKLVVDDAVYRSESETGHRNRAIGHLLRNFNIIESDPEPALDLYFRQCAISVDCRDLAVMASTLACQGRNPFTGQTPLAPDLAVRVLALMGSCGMYDFAGQWLHDVGIPAKSGVAGGVLAVMPGRLGIAIYSPPLDSYGNSVRGVAVCSDLSHGVGLSLFNQCPQPPSTIRRSYRGSQRVSRRWRSDQESRVLDPLRDQISILHIQGALDFAALEQLSAALVALPSDTRILILDLAHVSQLPPSAAALLVRQLTTLLEHGLTILLSRAARLSPLEVLSTGMAGRLHCFDHLDSALEAAENLLLTYPHPTTNTLLPPHLSRGDSDGAEVGFLALLPSASRETLLQRMTLRFFRPGETVIRRGDPGDELFVVRQGRFNIDLETTVGTGEPHRTRLATFGQGMCFGEIAFIACSLRTADITSMEAGSCWVLDRTELESLEKQQPAVVIDLLKALTGDLGHKLSLASHQLTLMEIY